MKTFVKQYFDCVELQIAKGNAPGWTSQRQRLVLTVKEWLYYITGYFWGHLISALLCTKGIDQKESLHTKRSVCICIYREYVPKIIFHTQKLIVQTVTFLKNLKFVQHKNNQL